MIFESKEMKALILFSPLLLTLVAGCSESHFVTAEPKGNEYRSFKDCEHCPAMVKIDMGHLGFKPSSWGDFNVKGDWDIEFDYKLAVGKYEVTQAEFNRCVRSNACDPVDFESVSDASSVAANGVMYPNAVNYLNWLSSITNYEYRLPSEAEWLYFTLAGRDQRYWWGMEFDQSQVYCALCDRELPLADPFYEIARFEANHFGLFDVMGNVTEWVADCADHLFAPAGKKVDIELLRSSTNPVGPIYDCGCELRMLKGGGFESKNGANGSNAISVARNLSFGSCDSLEKYESRQEIGLRVVRRAF